MKQQPDQGEFAVETIVPPTGLGGVGLIYSQPKSGKSTLAASLVDVCLDTHNGMNHIAGAKRINVRGYGHTRKAIGTLRDKQRTSFSLDVIDDFVAWANFFIAQKYGEDSVADLGYGKGWDKLARLVIDEIAAWRKMFKFVLLVGHQKLEGADGNYRLSRHLDLPGRLSRMVCSAVDFIGRTDIETDSEGRQRYFIDFTPQQDFDQGNRLAALRNQRIEFFDDLKKNREIFNALFQKKEDK